MHSLPPSLDSSLDATGNTPVVRLRNVVPEGQAKVFLELEPLNPIGSCKNRIARPIIEEAECLEKLKSGMTVVEFTGSTGSSLAFITAVKGYKFHVVSSNAFAARENKDDARLGATVDIYTTERVFCRSSSLP